MPLLLRKAALLWGEINLKNNDIAFEVITPAAQLQVNVYATKREEEAAAM